MIGKVEYKKHTYSGSNGNDWKQYEYTNYKDWTDEASKEDSSYGNASVKKYGGFYIGRYEAGWNGDPVTKIDTGSDYVDTWANAVTKLNVTNQKPVSKKGVFSWNFISQEHAKTVSENMYKNSDSDVKEGNVQSKLVDGTAWDTITNWIATDNVDVTSSSKYGNYVDTDIPYTGLYAKHIWAQHINTDTTDHWLCAKHFSNGAITLKQEQIQKPYAMDKASEYADTNIQNQESHNFWTRYELPTGSLENFKLKNIYDLAGNMWEWTTEVGNHTSANAQQTNGSSFAVVRGGSFVDDGTDYPLCFRHGSGSSSTHVHVNLGFRVVLYVK